MHQWWDNGTAWRCGMCEYVTWTDFAADRLPWSPLPASPASIWPSPLSMTRVAVVWLQRRSRSSSGKDMCTCRVLVWSLRFVPIQFFNFAAFAQTCSSSVVTGKWRGKPELKMLENGRQKLCGLTLALQKETLTAKHRHSVEYTIDYRFSLLRIYPY